MGTQGQGMCDMQERRCSLLDLGHGNVQFGDVFAGWRPNYSHTSFVNSVPNPTGTLEQRLRSVDIVLKPIMGLAGCG